MTDIVEVIAARIWTVECSGDLERREGEGLEVWTGRRIRSVAQAALTALSEAGFAVVPKVPTEAMIAAPAYKVSADGEGLLSDGDTTNAVWIAMLAASKPSLVTMAPDVPRETDKGLYNHPFTANEVQTNIVPSPLAAPAEDKT